MQPAFLDHYLAMIEPRSRSSELRQIRHGEKSGGIVVEAPAAEVLTWASRTTEVFVDYVQWRRQSMSNVNLVSIFANAGAVFELHQSGLFSANEASQAERIFDKLDDCLSNLDERGWCRLEQHLVAYSKIQYSEWEKYDCIAHKEESFPSFFDTNLNKDVDFLEVGDIESFIKEAKVSDRYQANILSFDRTDYLYARALLSRAIPLARSLRVDTGLDEGIEKTDGRIRGISIPAEFPQAESVRYWYQPEDFYWWYYSIPKTLHVEYG